LVTPRALVDEGIVFGHLPRTCSLPRHQRIVAGTPGRHLAINVRPAWLYRVGVAFEDPDVRTTLAEIRIGRRISQAELAKVTGLSRRTIQRLEAGHFGDAGPHLGHLAQCAIALGVPLEAVIDPAWRVWRVFSPDAAEPPPERWWEGTVDQRWNMSPYSDLRGHYREMNRRADAKLARRRPAPRTASASATASAKATEPISSPSRRSPRRPRLVRPQRHRDRRSPSAARGSCPNHRGGHGWSR
jgi:transcriptional regulator with XRE-family HTH domain